MSSDQATIKIAKASNSLKLAAILTENQVKCQLAATNRNELIDELLGLISGLHSQLDVAQAKTAILEREAVFPTVIAPGLAVPHARLPELNAPIMAMGLSKKGIDFGSAETENAKVKVAILLLTPENNPALHLQLLAALSRAFSASGLIDKLLEQKTPSEVITLMTGGKNKVPDFLKAGDLMDPKTIALLETDTLRRAIHVFATTGEPELPVIDDDGDLRGVLSTTDLLKLSFPPHLLWLEDLTPINRFQPFADMLKSAGDTRLADIMRDDYIAVDKELPAIQLAKLFIVNQVNKIAVVDNSGKLIGMVRLSEFCAKLFWE